jgi:hypothetical protein
VWAIALIAIGLGMLVAGTAAAEDGPDLVVEDLSVDADEVEGETVDADAWIANVGDETANASEVRLRLDDGRIFEEEIGELGAGDGTIVFVEWTAEAGEHTLTVEADALDDVDEANEANNEAVTSYSVAAQPQPNLVPGEVSLTYEDPVDGEEIEADVAVTNAADPDVGAEYAVAGTFVVEVRRDGEVIEKARIDQELDPGQTEGVEVGPWTARGGDHDLTIVVDEATEIAEANETDNRKTTSYTVLAEPPAPNLVAHAPELVLAETEVPIEGQMLGLRSHLDHTGAGVEDVAASFGVDGEPVAGTAVPELPHRRGTLMQVTQAWGAHPGQHELGVSIDPADRIDETDEADNSALRTVTVLEQADPGVVEVAVSEPLVPWQGHDVRVDLANVGEGPMVQAADLVVEVCPSDPSPSPRCEVLEAPTAVQLPPGETQRVQTSWDAQGSVGEFEVCASLAYPVIQEAAVNDETCTSTYAVAAGGPLGGVQTG